MESMLKLMECYKIKNNDVIMIVIDRYVDDFGPESLENICSSCKGLNISMKFRALVVIFQDAKGLLSNQTFLYL